MHRSVDWLITGGLVITMDSGRRVHTDGAVAVSKDRIVAVGPSADVMAVVEPQRMLDAKRKAILPGLIDAHAHAGHSLTRTLGVDLPHAEWLKLVDHIYFQCTTPEYWFADGLLSSLERIRFGTTCAVMMLGSVPRTDDVIYGDAFARGCAEIGARTILSVGPPPPPWPRTFTSWDGDSSTRMEVAYDHCLAVTRELLQTWGRSEGRIRTMAGPSRFSVPSPYDRYANDPEHLELAKKQAEDIRSLANEFKLFIHTHAHGEAIAYVYDHFPGVLGPDVLLAHCVGISEREGEILADLGIKVAHCPLARPALFAQCPVSELIDAGVTVAVASDASAPDRTFDLFASMRGAQRLQRVHHADSNYLPPGKMLESVTIDAALAIGMQDEIGSLEIGKKADLVLVDLWKPHMVPTIMPLWRLVYEAFGQDVTHVFIDGQPILFDGVLCGIDQDEVLERADEEAKKMLERADVQGLLNPPKNFWGASRYVDDVEK